MRVRRCRYWDVVWNKPGSPTRIDKLAGTSFKIRVQNKSQIEISFTKTWNEGVPLNVDQKVHNAAWQPWVLFICNILALKWMA
ncbi:hypothetical protein F0562_003117 [Nyssa sinensis]|uniref:Uncharacterized protein n=1 Tax=Nyssa sinensis TaxID=561372 RepID=A0A5J5BYE0_9ASTE|nr:hypothetical protein F0562_003117 [Nyssa sinensis]